jgi:general secretion pathway protein D
MKPIYALFLTSGFVALSACGTKAMKPSAQHLQQTPETVQAPPRNIPPASKNAVVLPPPKAAVKVETYSVVVTNLPAHDLLFALARDAKLNSDIHPSVQGEVSINAINQTLPQILDRISRQVDMRYEISNGVLVVMPDSPYLKSYKIDYVNMSRDAEGGVANGNQIGGGLGVNNSRLTITNTTKNHFWETLVKNVTDMLRETDKILPEGSSETTVQQNGTKSTSAPAKPNAKTAGKDDAGNNSDATVIEGEGTTVTRRSTFREAASVISNPEAGVLTVRATSRQHEKINEYITQVMRNARRQVLIEATIAEVHLSSNYQQGINWSRLIPAGKKGISIGQGGAAVTPGTQTTGAMILNYADPTSAIATLAGSVKLLETFGDVKVLSSPKLSVMNNQTAMLRVVDNNVYFIVSSTTTPATATSGPITTYTTVVNTIPVGFSMSVTPQISENDTVLLNVRPTITRLLTPADDPTPNLLVKNQIPQVSTREMESVLKIENNQIAILGGLMQDEIDNQSNGIPGLSSLPFLGNAFKNRDDTKTKTELVIFLRPVVIKESSLNGDYSNYRGNLPDEQFLKPESEKAQP